MADNELKIVYLPIGSLKPYEKNARKHADKDVQTIVNSIKEFGFDDPIGIWGEKNLIVEGHGRLLAAKKLGMEEVPCIRLDHLTDEQRRAYALAHNKTAEMSEWDFGILGGELDDIFDIDMSTLGFELGEADGSVNGYLEEPDWSDRIKRYSNKVDIPQYTPTMEKPPEIKKLYSTEKTDALKKHILEATLDEETKNFLIAAANRHLRFDYRNIAEFYAHASREIQQLMEESALVIIDVGDAIKNGFANLKDVLSEAENDE